jgi:uncharacterized protein (TIGR03067 family)
MGEDNGWKINLATAAIGAVGAIGAAAVPLYLSRPSEPAADATKAATAPAPAPSPVPAPVTAPKSAPDPAPEVAAKPAPTPAPPPDPKPAPTPAPAPKTVAVAKSKAAAEPAAKAETKGRRPDLAHLQGDWAIVAETVQAKVMTKDDLATTKPIWTFHGREVSVHNSAKGDEPTLKGTITLHPDAHPRTFDLSGQGQGRNKRPIEMIGIYQFEGPAVLLLHFRTRRNSDAPLPPRPDSFDNDPGPNFGTLLRLRRVKG